MAINTTEGIKPGDLYTTDGKDVWVMETILTMPSVVLRKLESDIKVAGCVCAPILDEFVPLVRESR